MASKENVITCFTWGSWYTFLPTFTFTCVHAYTPQMQVQGSDTHNHQCTTGHLKIWIISSTFSMESYIPGQSVKRPDHTVENSQLSVHLSLIWYTARPILTSDMLLTFCFLLGCQCFWIAGATAKTLWLGHQPALGHMLPVVSLCRETEVPLVLPGLGSESGGPDRQGTAVESCTSEVAGPRLNCEPVSSDAFRGTHSQVPSLFLNLTFSF
jgi:hypothetical protein